MLRSEIKKIVRVQLSCITLIFFILVVRRANADEPGPIDLEAFTSNIACKEVPTFAWKATGNPSVPALPKGNSVWGMRSQIGGDNGPFVFSFVCSPTNPSDASTPAIKVDDGWYPTLFTAAVDLMTNHDSKTEIAVAVVSETLSIGTFAKAPTNSGFKALGDCTGAVISIGAEFLTEVAPGRWKTLINASLMRISFHDCSESLKKWVAHRQELSTIAAARRLETRIAQCTNAFNSGTLPTSMLQAEDQLRRQNQDLMNALKAQSVSAPSPNPTHIPSLMTPQVSSTPVSSIPPDLIKQPEHVVKPATPPPIILPPDTIPIRP